jgi:hypothetical protein
MHCCGKTGSEEVATEGRDVFSGAVTDSDAG